MIGSIPQFVTRIYENNLSWLRTLLISTKPDIRQLAAKIYGLITAQLSNNEFEAQISEIMGIIDKNNLEAQHGSLLTLTYMMERRLVFKRSNINNDCFNWDLYINVVRMICMYIFRCNKLILVHFLILFKNIIIGNFLHNNSILLLDAAIQSIGILGKTCELPLSNEGKEEPNKKEIVEILFSVLNNVKLNTKVDIHIFIDIIN